MYTRKFDVQPLVLSKVMTSLILLTLLPTRGHAKSIIEPCFSSSDSCSSLLSYLLPWDSKVSEIAYRFNINISDLLSSNAITPTSLTYLGNQIIRAKNLVKIPISCPCIDGIRQSKSITHTVQPGDTVESISADYGRLVSGDQISSINGIGSDRALTDGDEIVISLPCKCFNNSNNGVPAVYMSYVVQEGEDLSSIGGKYGTTVMELEAINGLGQPVLDPGDILAVPISACSSANLNWHNGSLTVPNGTYALTANDCIKCTCGPRDLNLRCVPSGIPTHCPHLQCKGSNLFIGDGYVNHTTIYCNVTICQYRGHNGTKIFKSLVRYPHIRCADSNNFLPLTPPLTSPLNFSLPFKGIPSPSPSPSSTFNQVGGSDTSSPIGEQNPNSFGKEIFHIGLSDSLILILSLILYIIIF